MMPSCRRRTTCASVAPSHICYFNRNLHNAFTGLEAATLTVIYNMQDHGRSFQPFALLLLAHGQRQPHQAQHRKNHRHHHEVQHLNVGVVACGCEGLDVSVNKKGKQSTKDRRSRTVDAHDGAAPHRPPHKLPHRIVGVDHPLRNRWVEAYNQALRNREGSGCAGVRSKGRVSRGGELMTSSNIELARLTCGAAVRKQRFWIGGPNGGPHWAFSTALLPIRTKHMLRQSFQTTHHLRAAKKRNRMRITIGPHMQKWKTARFCCKCRCFIPYSPGLQERF